MYGVMQSDRNIFFLGNIILGSVNMAFRDKTMFFTKVHEIKYIRILVMKILILLEWFSKMNI